MIVLVTGANGLVGRHVIDRLSVEENIFLLAQFRNSPLPCWEANNISLVKTSLESNKSESLLDANAPDLIVHCAAQIPTVKLSSESAAQINKNIDLTIYHFANRREIPVIFISSAIVYETSSCVSIESISLQPSSSYAQQKYESELLFSKLNNPSVAFRISSPYGGFQKPERNVLYKFIHTALNNGVLNVHGTGVRRQDFIGAVDIAEAVWAIVLTKLSGKNLTGIFNVARGSCINMKDLAELVVNISGQGTVVCSGETDIPEHTNPQIDINKARETFGWKPTMPFAKGVENTISLLRELR